MEVEGYSNIRDIPDPCVNRRSIDIRGSGSSQNCVSYTSYL